MIEITSETRGALTVLKVQPGQRGNAGDVVVIIESMKTEIPVLATESGVVSQLVLQPGALVDYGTRIALLNPSG